MVNAKMVIFLGIRTTNYDNVNIHLYWYCVWLHMEEIKDSYMYWCTQTVHIPLTLSDHSIVYLQLSWMQIAMGKRWMEVGTIKTSYNTESLITARVYIIQLGRVTIAGRIILTFATVSPHCNNSRCVWLKKLIEDVNHRPKAIALLQHGERNKMQQKYYR